MTYISALNLNKIDLVSTNSQINDLSYIYAELSNLDSNIKINSNNITLINNRVNSNVIELIDLDLRLVNAEDDITDTNNAVILANTNILINSNNIESLSNSVSNNTFEINDLEIRVTEAETDITSLSGFIITNSNNITSLSNVVTIHTNEISLLSNNYFSVSNVVSNLSNNYTATSNLVNINTGQIIINSNNIVSLSNYVNTISSGGGGFAPSASNITVVNSNIPVSVLNVANPYKMSAYISAQYNNTTTTTFQAVKYDTIIYDSNNNFNTTNYAYTVPITGIYEINAIMSLVSTNGGTATFFQVGIYDITTAGAGLGTPIGINEISTTVGNIIPSIFIKNLTAGTIIAIKVRAVAGTALAVGQSGQIYNNLTIQLQSVSTPTTIPIVSTTNINAYSYTGSGNIMTGQNNSNNYIPVWSSNNSTFLNNGINPLDLTAYKLATTSSNVNISSGIPPTTGQVLTAQSASNAIWATPSGGGGGLTVAKNVSYSYSLGANASTVVITHSLGVIPKKITMVGTYNANQQTSGLTFTKGGGAITSIFYNYTPTVCSIVRSNGDKLGSNPETQESFASSSTNTMFQSGYHTGTITLITATTFTMSFTGGGTGSTGVATTANGTLIFICEA